MNDTNENTPENTDSTECTGTEATEECCGGGSEEASGDGATTETTEECCGDATTDTSSSDDAGECGGSDDSCGDSA